MMATERLFYQDAYCRAFDAAVLSAGQDERGWYLVLNRTAFYPEGGGQPADQGFLFMEPERMPQAAGAKEDPGRAGTMSARNMDGDSEAGCQVQDVQIVGGEIRHYVDRMPASLHKLLTGASEGCGGKGSGKDVCRSAVFRTPPGQEFRVRGIIDWERRFDLMQQHSGEHIVSGWIHRRYGYDNVGFHMGEDVITIDLNGRLDTEQLAQIEAEVNGWIWEDHAAHIFFPDDREREALPYRSKKELTGEVRLVEFPGADLCACCGMHVRRSGEIGLVKLLSVKHFREGVRIEMVSGRRAFALLNRSFLENGRISVALSVPPERTMEAVERLQAENYSLRGQVLGLQNERSRMRAEQCRGKGDVLVLETGLDAAQIRKEADAVLDVCGGVCTVISLDASAGEGSGKGEQSAAANEKASGKYAIGERDGDVRALVKEMNGALQGKGGGKPFFAQGSLQADREEIIAFFAGKHFTVFG